jgi:hypothetical protein
LLEIFSHSELLVVVSPTTTSLYPNFRNSNIRGLGGFILVITTQQLLMFYASFVVLKVYSGSTNIYFKPLILEELM